MYIYMDLMVYSCYIYIYVFIIMHECYGIYMMYDIYIYIHIYDDEPGYICMYIYNDHIVICNMDIIWI